MRPEAEGAAANALSADRRHRHRPCPRSASASGRSPPAGGASTPTSRRSTLLRQAFDRGITFFDTADTYGNGRGETLLAQAFPGADRDDIVIASKFGYDWQSTIGQRREGHQEAPHRLDLPFLEQALEGSLRRLGTDHIDLWQLHNVRMEHLQRDEVWTFLDRREAGRQGARARRRARPGDRLARRGRRTRSRERAVDVVQMIYNALELDPGRELIAAARARPASRCIVRVPHSSGMLEGHYSTRTRFAAERPPPAPPARPG